MLAASARASQYCATTATPAASMIASEIVGCGCIAWMIVFGGFEVLGQNQLSQHFRDVFADHVNA
jgi:hypothetical protein